MLLCDDISCKDKFLEPNQRLQKCDHATCVWFGQSTKMERNAWFKQSDKDDDQHDHGREKQINFILRMEDACVNVQQQCIIC